MEPGRNKDGTVSLNYPMLTRTNYTAWAMKMKVYMQAHGVWDAVEPKDPNGVVEEKIDKLALAAIYQSIPEDILLSLADKETAKAAWEAIKVMSQGAEHVKSAKVQTLKAEFEAMNMKDTDSLDVFCLKITALVTNIRALGEVVAESYVVKKLLRAIPPKFLQIASTIEQFENLETMTFEETVGSLKAHEERMRGPSEGNGSQLLLTEEEWMKKEKEESKFLLTHDEWNKRSNRGGLDQKVRARDNNRGVRDRSRARCFNCNLLGHFAADCRRPKRDRDNKEEVNIAQLPNDEPALLLNELEDENEKVVLITEERVSPKLSQEAERNQMKSNLWYLDNGASNHMTGQRSKFRVLDEKVTGQVKFGDGSVVHMKGRGSVVVRGKTGEERTLRHVYYIPSLCSNIISIGQLAEEGNKVTIGGDYLWVRDACGTLLMKVKRTQNSGRRHLAVAFSIGTCKLQGLKADGEHEDGAWVAKAMFPQECVCRVSYVKTGQEKLSVTVKLQHKEGAEVDLWRFMWSHLANYDCR
ncbi:uncharacterized protein LOC141695814 [Apium graveolens]|uniref:uncharacterized protein LOC141695814 n=1 Tax=Apium graveolens TaxID=4045 RepID=UPI003D7A89F7